MPGRNGVYLWLEAGVRPTEVLGPEDDASLELVVLRQDGLSSCKMAPDSLKEQCLLKGTVKREIGSIAGLLVLQIPETCSTSKRQQCRVWMNDLKHAKFIGTGIGAV